MQGEKGQVKEDGFMLCSDMVLIMALPPPSAIVLLEPQLCKMGGWMQLRNHSGKAVMPHFQPHIPCRPAHSWTAVRKDGDEESDWRQEVATMKLLLVQHQDHGYHNGWRSKGLEADGPAPSSALAMPLHPAFVPALGSLAGKPSLWLPGSRQQELCRVSLMHFASLAFEKVKFLIIIDPTSLYSSQNCFI